MKKQCQSTLNAVRKYIFSLIPESKLLGASRSKRGLMNFIGSLSKTLFGTATVDDINVLAQHVQSLNKIEFKLANNLKQHEEHVSSFMSIVDDRFDNAMEAIKHNHDDIRSSVVLFNNKVNDIQQSLESLTGLLIDQLEQVAIINTQVEELKLGVLSLVNGKLSPYIRPTLSLDWPDFTVKSKISQISLHIPDHIRISILQAILLRRLILQPFSAYILVIHNGYYSVLDTGTMRTDRRMFQSSPV
jgi:hypothetical protein